MGDEETWRIRDPVHGLVVFGEGPEYQKEADQIALRLINTREFQRLRRIRHLGFSELVYPGATHSRFAHSVGVYHVARQLMEVIRRTGKKYDNQFCFKKEKARAALLAALLHDIGHGPLSHVFEQAGKKMSQAISGQKPPVHWERSHEIWSAEIVQGETQVNQVLREATKGKRQDLPKDIGRLLRAEQPKDIYASVFSSQFDADRLDYLQRDRLMTGIQSGNIDYEWLLNCLEVGPGYVGEAKKKAPLLCLNSKGVQVAEEYLEGRFRLYKAVYMHKTTRAAEMMLHRLLAITLQKAQQDKDLGQDPILKYFTSQNPEIDLYLSLDDASVWATLATLSSYTKCARISELALRLRERSLYKVHREFDDDQKFSNFKDESRKNQEDRFLFDDEEIVPYRWYDFSSDKAFSKVLVKNDEGTSRDIADISDVVKALRDKEQILRVYSPDGE